MRIDERKRVHSVANEHIVIEMSEGGADLTTVVGLNESAAWLHERLSGREFGVDDVVALLTAEYDVDEKTARKDAEAWVEEMKAHGLIV